MLRLTVSKEEYLLINNTIKIVFLGGTGNHVRIMIDAPKDIEIVRSKAIMNHASAEEKEKLPTFYAEPSPPAKYRKPQVYIVNKNQKFDSHH